MLYTVKSAQYHHQSLPHCIERKSSPIQCTNFNITEYGTRKWLLKRSCFQQQKSKKKMWPEALMCQKHWRVVSDVNVSDVLLSSVWRKSRYCGVQFLRKFRLKMSADGCVRITTRSLVSSLFGTQWIIVRATKMWVWVLQKCSQWCNKQQSP